MRWIPTFLTICLLLLGGASWGAEVRFSAAASLSDPLNAACSAYAATRPVRCLPNYGGSGTLAKQIAQGAPADLFISADPAWIDFLRSEGRLSSREVKSLAGNRLVFVGKPGRGIKALSDVRKLERIAIGTPGSVPAGRYAEQSLRKAGIYDQLLCAGKIVMAQDVRQALLYAERGDAEGAFVYRTDALLAKKGAILFEVPAGYHSPVVYPMALTAQGEKNREALAFFQFLQGPQGRQILKKYGFLLP